MATFLTGDEKYRDVIYDDDYRSYLMDQRDAPGDYRFGRTQGKRVRVRARTALRRVNGYLKTMIEAIANAKLRRMERELELRGIRFDRPNDNWVTRKSQPTERS
jgi:GDP-D-mannose dehydratase